MTDPTFANMGAHVVRGFIAGMERQQRAVDGQMRDVGASMRFAIQCLFEPTPIYDALVTEQRRDPTT